MNDSTMKMARRTIYRSAAQKLTDGMRGFLERQPFAMLGTYNPDGLIHMVTLSYIFEDGRFFWRHRRRVAKRATSRIGLRRQSPWTTATLSSGSRQWARPSSFAGGALGRSTPSCTAGPGRRRALRSWAAARAE